MPWNPVQNIRTDENGTYKLKGFIPGYYVVRYSYGDDVSRNDMLIFNGQDYKSTKYTGVADWTDTDVKDEDARLYGMQAKNKSDARDDEIRRLETIAYSETMVNKKAVIGENVEIQDGVYIGSNVKIGDGCKICANAVLNNCIIDKNTFIGANACVSYAEIGQNCIIQNKE